MINDKKWSELYSKYLQGSGNVIHRIRSVLLLVQRSRATLLISVTENLALLYSDAEITRGVWPGLN